MRAGLLILLMLVSPVASRAETTRLQAGAASSVQLKGSSNVARWQCSGTSIEAAVAIATSAEHINEVIDRIEDGNMGVWMADRSRGSFPLPQFELEVPVATFRCGNAMMEKDMRKALKADRFPQVLFSFSGLIGGVRHDIDSRLYHARISGTLALAGVTRPIDLEVSAERISTRSFRIRAVLPLLMTDFGVTPPSALLGAIKARDALTVNFDLMLDMFPAGDK